MKLFPDEAIPSEAEPGPGKLHGVDGLFMSLAYQPDKVILDFGTTIHRFLELDATQALKLATFLQDTAVKAIAEKVRIQQGGR